MRMCELHIFRICLKKPKALLDICYRAKGNGAPGKLVLKGVKHPK